jgi:SWI/SNF-related matrix-associated actin-dependent regulator 1 of chromatin subfamily A
MASDSHTKALAVLDRVTPREKLFPYQEVGAEYLASHRQALLADEMGLGKSAQAIVASDRLNAARILVIVPANGKINWDRQFKKFSLLLRDIHILDNAADPVPSPFPSSETGGFVVICSYEIATAKRKELMDREWTVLILDEAHYLKNRKAERTRAVYGRSRVIKGIADTARYVWRLTGTPMPNAADELYTHLKSAGLVDYAYWDFVSKFCTGFASTYGFKIQGTKNVPELKRLLSQFMLRRKKGQVMPELPKIVFHEFVVQSSELKLDDIEVEFYDQLAGSTLSAFFQKIKEQDASVRLALKTIKENTAVANLRIDERRADFLNGMAAATSTMRRYVGMSKLDAMAEKITEELDSDRKQKRVIFAHHKAVIEGLRDRLCKFHPVTLYGGTPPAKRQLWIDRFQNDPSCRVFIGNILAAGTVIDLTSAHYVDFAEADWSPENNAQAIMRCHRIGQKHVVHVRFFSAANTVDEEVNAVLIRKTREISKVLDD